MLCCAVSLALLLCSAEFNSQKKRDHNFAAGRNNKNQNTARTLQFSSSSIPKNSPHLAGRNSFRAEQATLESSTQCSETPDTERNKLATAHLKPEISTDGKKTTPG